ncbi:MAG: acetolactate synthase large subunit [Candidatus Nanopelagicales bacterium]|nr:acetolactate synthase large subunit [Candidatus Nanopelagicales bacterium]
MNGAQSLIRTLVDSGVEVCFSNPGTSEMHFVVALDDVPEMRGVLVLFEGVATGAADGYARMTGRPAATLLHLGPGLGNGIANLHNARKGKTPVVNIVGDHATYHRKYDAQLQSDIETVARNASSWVRTSRRTVDVAADAADAVAASLGPPGQVATLILPADVSWLEGGVPAAPRPATVPPVASDQAIERAVAALRSGEPTALFLGGTSLLEPGLMAAARIAQATGAKLLAETFPARLERGAGIPPIDRLGYLAEMASVQLAGLSRLILVDAKAPVSFFAYPDKPSYLVPNGCEPQTLAADTDDSIASLTKLAEALGVADSAVACAELSRPDIPSGDLTVETFAQVLGALLPENAIVSDEANTSGLLVPIHTAGSPRHDWLNLTGGSIGQGLPVATGAAVACPDRPVLCLDGDGSSLYTIQSLWTQAREGLDVTTIIFNNRSYSILNMELGRVGAHAAREKAKRMLSLEDPELDFVAISRGLGVPATRAATCEELADSMRKAFAEPGPHLIEAMVPAMF